ncbi:pyrimidine dimer DNA glycosylase/endonuclease V [Shewanella sp. C32]|uniref:Pyrimidine dimer DNA glycosylase/endonuclease V n=1 Tax=Shewanella electrica TaxID=515560 RepID=A0ABT2FLX2_9GAMM|nr:pyrimidine dimer DNA glycosylase/endonuclease V [Shewanella electrica]MCH1925785.1 pyrimidine dimer DNA glycosylase/endonuclease V [Shewanella electrica]MCS4557330.1 pyrimidine dimer DNA glycosylase/endonuclease V [Shewanella electrica]
MNILVLDENITLCAQYHCDQHVIKMILESVQLLCTALNKQGFDTPYKSTHIKHPCVLWVEQSYDNFEWLVQLTYALNDEYRYRFDKAVDHKSIAVLRQIETLQYARCGLTPFPQAMPEPFKVAGDAVQAYRNFYIGDKLRFAKWTKRPLPQWFVDAVAVQPN